MTNMQGREHEQIGLKISSLSKSFGSVSVLRNLDLELHRGELLVVVGPSGCGKSTLLRLIAGLEKPTHGAIHIAGKEVGPIAPNARSVAMVFQNYALYPHMSVFDNMAYALKIARHPKPEIKAKVHGVAERLRLSPYLDRLPKTLSGGQQQRVAIGRAMVRDPKLYLFDEPLSNLDASLRVSMRSEIARLKAEMPESTMIYVTHDQIEAMTLADRVAVLSDQGIVQIGTPMELYDHPQTEFVARFIGSPEMNMLPAQISRTGADTEVTLAGGGVVRVPIPSSPDLEGAFVTLGVRPEHIALSPEPDLLSASVERVEALGDVSHVHLAIENADRSEIVAKLPGDHTGLRSRRVSLSIQPQKLHLFHNGRALPGPSHFLDRNIPG
ncbi:MULTISPECIES: ABC transporter ATP-binding protein [unclassified Aliiroseovarius]|uniref:ABC transporter ATP-binding protein n=1 Tax=unclassified Aliiroseovarius TaxID=2623558 RepID=UPI0020C398E1|nr:MULTISPECIES: ABC transporter ATP-binding protein [unclassified Aliiroseovarius]